jgi:ribosomal protein S18 acetylase RimI-like enzyme
VSPELTISWRGDLADREMVGLVNSHGGIAEAGWWDRIRQYSLGWVTARDDGGRLVGFVNVAWDGSDHAFLLDTKTRGDSQRQGIGTAVVDEAVRA